MKVPVFSAVALDLTVNFVDQYKDKPVWGRKGKRAHFEWHLLPHLYTHLYKNNTLQTISICGSDIRSKGTIYCFNPIGRREKRCEKCVLMDTMKELAE